MKNSMSSHAVKSNRWADLGPRTASALVLLLVGGGASYLGGVAFALFVSLSVGAVFWEVTRMYRKDNSLAAVGYGVAAAALVFLACFMPLIVAVPVLALPLLLGIRVLEQRKTSFLVILAWVLLGGFGLVWLRDAFWVSWTVWLICVVVATDVAGYFAGKYFGGPKFWPAVSPKKTWSGTAGGWVAAAGVGLIFSVFAGLPANLIWISVLVSMASQAGDIAESALKRRMDVKDSSQLIPGHGGVFDRFDGMLGAGALCFLIAVIWG